MKHALLCLLLLPGFAAAEMPAGYERLILSIAPSYSLCGYQSRYDTRLLVFNEGDADARPVCVGTDCVSVAARKTATVEGPETMKPLPAFLYVPRDTPGGVHLTLMVESSQRERGRRAFAEIPILRESDFRKSVQLLGVRVEDGFRVTLRIYGLDTPDGTLSLMRIFDMDTGEPLHEEIYGFEPFPNAPSVAMECDIGEIGKSIKYRNLRIEVISSRDDAPVYAFVSMTDNATQRFTMITPK